jgi:hypothetical protein
MKRQLAFAVCFGLFAASAGASAARSDAFSILLAQDNASPAGNPASGHSDPSASGQSGQDQSKTGKGKSSGGGTSDHDEGNSSAPSSPY